MKIGSKARPEGAFLALLGSLSLILSLATPALAEMPPDPPHFFNGAVTIGADPAPQGTMVSARVDGGEVASTTVDADGNYQLYVSASSGDIVDFYVAGVWADSHPWEKGRVTLLNLAIGDIIPPTVSIDPVISPTHVPTQTLSGTMEEGATVALTADTDAIFGDVTYPTPTTWTAEVTLVEGPNVITATATDAAGNRGTAEVTIVYQPEVAVELSMVLQGGARPPEGWEIPVTINFFQPGADVLEDTPIKSLTVTTVKVEDRAVAQVSIAPGTYDITVASETTLINVRRNVEIAAPALGVDMGTLLEGNANGDHLINMMDFSILAGSFGKAEGDEAFDKRADFDRNGIVNIADFSLLAGNFMSRSPVEIP
ncbi:hypothetical protein M1O56_03990 [Dehalococcoidia bacterium]|nr:hypothetical protein [Dehalococcoidia bacterium]